MAHGKVLSIFGVRPTRIGSNEAFARELSRQLGDAGWQSILGFLETPADPVRRFLELPNVTLDVVQAMADPGWRSATNFLAAVRRHKPDVLHLHYTPFLSPLPWLAKACSVRRVFITDHTSRPEGHVILAAPMLKRVMTRAINAPVRTVISVSEYGYRCMTGLRVLPADRFRMIYNSVDVDRIAADPALGSQFRARHGIPANRVLALQVSWIIPQKGIVDVLETARRIVDRTDTVHFVLAGEGAFRAEYTRMAENLGLKNFVTWTGLVENPLAEGLFAAADIVCQMSRWEEVFGWTIAEAMAHGKPLVATRVGGIPELVRDGISGFLVDRGDINAMADRISILAESPALRAQMGDAGRRDVAQRFDLATNVAALIDLYELPPRTVP